MIVSINNRRKGNMNRANAIRFLSHRLCFLSKIAEIHLLQTLLQRYIEMKNVRIQIRNSRLLHYNGSLFYASVSPFFSAYSDGAIPKCLRKMVEK